MLGANVNWKNYKNYSVFIVLKNPYNIYSQSDIFSDTSSGCRILFLEVSEDRNKAMLFFLRATLSYLSFRS